MVCGVTRLKWFGFVLWSSGGREGHRVCCVVWCGVWEWRVRKGEGISVLRQWEGPLISEFESTAPIVC